MPLYGQRCLAKKCGHYFEDARPIAECDNQPKCPKCGGSSDRDYTPSSSQGHWPEYASDALGVHPDQVPEMKSMFPHHRFNSQGQMLIGSHGEFKRVLKDLGMTDRNKVTHGNRLRGR